MTGKPPAQDPRAARADPEAPADPQAPGAGLEPDALRAPGDPLAGAAEPGSPVAPVAPGTPADPRPPGPTGGSADPADPAGTTGSLDPADPADPAGPAGTTGSLDPGETAGRSGGARDEAADAAPAAGPPTTAAPATDPPTTAASTTDRPTTDPPTARDAGRSASSRLGRNTAIFSVATALSRIVGLVREVVARAYFGTQGPMSAFTFAFQLPNLIRSLFADAALSAAFVPVFTELLEEDRRKDAATLAGTLLCCVLAALGAITALFILGAGVIIPAALSLTTFDAALTDLTVGLSRVLFPIVVLLGVNGLLVGILNAHGHFTVPALAPLVWNLVIIGVLVLARPLFDGPNEIYAYAIGVLAGTLVQLLMVVPVLRRIDFRLDLRPNLRDPRLRRVFALMLPVTLGLGIINFDVLISSFVGALISVEVPTAIEAAFRIYMLPQGIFSVAVATVLFPTLSRLAARRDFPGLRATMASGMRQILLLLIPAAAFTLVLAEPIVRLLYERGEFGPESTDLVAEALVWFSFALPFAGLNLLLTRTSFSLQKPWIPTTQSVLNLTVNAVLALALYEPLGIAGVVIATAVASACMTVGQSLRLKPLLGGSLEGARTLAATVRITAAAAVMALAAYAIQRGLEDLLGRSLAAQAVAMAAAVAAAAALYGAAVLALRVPEARQIERALRRRLGRAA